MKHNYTLSGELPEMVQAKLNAKNISEVDDTRHPSDGLWAFVREAFHAELNFYICCVNFQSCYKESWMKVRDGGYKLRLDAIPFQSAKASAEIFSDVSVRLTLVFSPTFNVPLKKGYKKLSLI